jgi:hypothetical protein
MATWRGSTRYWRYTTRSQKTRKAESASHGSVAAKRYSGTAARGSCGMADQGRTTGHQKRRPVTKKDAR